jgi:ubiquinone/menaquinone biosynthesis C-methylase UbiE
MCYYKSEADFVYGEIKNKGLNSWSELFDSCNHDNFVGREIWESLLERRPYIFQDVKIYEYGCGTGPLTKLLCGYARTIKATDVCDAALELARKIFVTPNLRFAVADFATPVLEAKKYDAVVSNFVLQQLVAKDERNQAYANVRRLLVDSGYHVFTTIISESNIDQLSIRPLSVDVRSFRLHPSVENLRLEVRSNGFDEVELFRRGTQCCMVSQRA